MNEELIFNEGFLLKFALGIASEIQRDLPRLQKSHLRVVRCLQVKLGLPNLTWDEVVDLAGQYRRYRSYIEEYDELALRLQLVQAELFAGHTASFADFLEEYLLCGAGGRELARSTDQILGEDVEEFIERLREADPVCAVN